MIVPMKKAAVIVQAKDADRAVETLRSLGVVHVEHQKPPKSSRLSAINDDLALLGEAIGILSAAESTGLLCIEKQKEPEDRKFTTRHIVDLSKRIEQLKEYSIGLINKISEWERWGDFDPEAIEALNKKNIYVGLYRIPAKQIKNLPSGIIVKRLSAAGGLTNCVIISRQKIDIPFKEMGLPKTGLKKMHQRLAEDEQAVKSIQDSIQRHICYHKALTAAKKGLQKELEFYQALNGMGSAGEIMYLTGYVPYDAQDLLLQTAKNQRWAVSIKDPSGEDKVPTLIRNPRWISLISPVFKALEIVPGYRELDISLLFLVFFSVFFGMLIGDAGYGLFYFVLTLFCHRKWGRKSGNGPIFTLFYILSSCAVVWGILSGTFFGQAWLPQWVKPLVPALRNDRNVQAVCFFLGALHLSIAHLWRAAIKSPSLAALADIGWAVVLWGAYLLAKTLVLGYDFPVFGKWFFITGPVLVVFFASPRRNILKGIGQGLGNLLMNFVNSFTDIVSYIRLFAVGLATVAVADAFNKMAMGVGYNGFISGLATSLILLLGHTLNIILGPLAVLVHGVRLNVLEFCNHVDVKWSGFAYKPLREK